MIAEQENCHTVFALMGDLLGYQVVTETDVLALTCRGGSTQYLQADCPDSTTRDRSGCVGSNAAASIKASRPPYASRV